MSVYIKTQLLQEYDIYLSLYNAQTSRCYRLYEDILLRSSIGLYGYIAEIFVQPIRVHCTQTLSFVRCYLQLYSSHIHCVPKKHVTTFSMIS